MKAKKSRQSLEIQMFWRGDLHANASLPKPMDLILGQGGPFGLPPDVLGDRPNQRLIADDRGSFSICVDNPVLSGQLIYGGHSIDLQEVQKDHVPGMKGPLLALTSGMRARVQYGEFVFHLNLSDEQAPPIPSDWRLNLPLFLGFLFATAIVLVPLLVGQVWVPVRVALRSFREDGLPIEVETAMSEAENRPTPPDLRMPLPAPRHVVVAPVERPSTPREPSLEPPAKPPEHNDKAVREYVKQLVDQKLRDLPSLAGPPALGAGRIFQTDDATGAPPPAGSGGSGNPDPSIFASTLQKPSVGPTEGHDPTGRQVLKPERIAVPDRVHVGDGHDKVARIHSRDLVATGGLQKAQIQRCVNARMGAIRACYQRGLQRKPEMGGRVKVTFFVLANGQVMTAKIENSALDDEETDQCIQKAFELARCDASSDGNGTKVVYPIVLKSN